MRNATSPDASSMKWSSANVTTEPEPIRTNEGDSRRPREREESVSFARWLAELVVMIGLAFLLAAGIRVFVVQPYVIPSGSMIPTLEIQDHVIANKFVYRFRDPVDRKSVV